MEFDIFFSISQTPDSRGYKPTELEMYSNFLDQAIKADELGFGVGWIAQAHLSTEVQKKNSSPVVPHYPGEVGLCTDFFQTAGAVLSRTKKMEVGSAVMSILASGGPIAQAERVGSLITLHGMDPSESRRIHIGFSAGRFEFMARPYGISPRNRLEEVSWKVLRGKIFSEASEIFLRLISGEVIDSSMIKETFLRRDDFRSDREWALVQNTAIEELKLDEPPDNILIPRRYEFESIATVPMEWNRDLLNLVLGSHDKTLQIEVNKWRPVQVFNLSITPPEVIEETHARMKANYHEDGGPWERSMMPRTVMVFLNDEPGLSESEKSYAALEESRSSIKTYWSALEGTIDPSKVERAVDNAVIGNVQDVANQLSERFHPDDRIMCWFDFFNHDNERVKRDMESFMTKVVPRVNGGV